MMIYQMEEFILTLRERWVDCQCVTLRRTTRLGATHADLGRFLSSSNHRGFHQYPHSSDCWGEHKKRFSGEQIINVSDRPFFQPDSLLETTSIVNF